MLELKHGDSKIDLPSSWEELNQRQLTYAVKCLSIYPILQAQLRIIFALLPLKWKRIFKSLDEFEMNALRSEFDFLKEPPEFSKWVFPRLLIGFRWYHGPEDLFAKLNVRQFARANFYLNKYSQHEDELALNKFLACIFLPKGVSFNDEYLQYSYKKFARFDLNKKKAMALNFTAVRAFLLNQAKQAFENNGAKSKADKYGWDGMVLYIAGKRNMVPDAIYNMKLSEFIIQLDATAIINKEIEKEKS